MDTERGRRAPDAIEAQSEGDIDALDLTNAGLQPKQSVREEIPLVEFIDKKGQENIGNAVNGRNPWEY